MRALAHTRLRTSGCSSVCPVVRLLYGSKRRRMTLSNHPSCELRIHGRGHPHNPFFNAILRSALSVRPQW
jgi:hypothetical protein